MKKSKQIYGQPTSEDLAAMKMDLEYLTDIDLTQHMNESYPAQGSHEEEKELQRVIDASNDPRLSPIFHEIADRLVQAPFQAQAESLRISYPGDLIEKVLRESQHYILILKYHYNRPRPTQVAERLGKSLDKELTPSAHSPSFPSGHAAQANLIATVMSRMYPRFKGQFNLVADSIERSRLESGLHFPSDIVAGRALGKHLGIISPLKRQTGLLESSEIDPVDVDKKIKVGLSLTIPEDLTVTDTLDAIKALKGITTVRQVGSQREQPALGRSVVNAFVTVVGGELSPEDLHRKVLTLDDIISVHIRNVDGKKYSLSKRPGRKEMTTAESLLRECVRVLLTEDERTDAGDRAQKRIAAWLVDQGMKASVNKSGSQSADVMGQRIQSTSQAGEEPTTIGSPGVIESKNSEAGSHVYSQELTIGSPIATAVSFLPGSVSGGLSFKRFRPAINKQFIRDKKKAIAKRKIENDLLKNALTKDTKEWVVIAGGTGPVGIGVNKANYGKQVQLDGSLMLGRGAPRSALIVVAPNIVEKIAKDTYVDSDGNEKMRTRKDPATGKSVKEWITLEMSNSERVWFVAEGEARKLRPALGGSGEENMGVFVDPGSEKLTKAWKEYYKGHDDYFAIVTGTQMYIGQIGSKDPLGLNLPDLSVELSMPSDSTMSYGGMNVTGLREKVMIRVVGGQTVSIPDDATADQYVIDNKITIRGS